MPSVVRVTTQSTTPGGHTVGKLMKAAQPLGHTHAGRLWACPLVTYQSVDTFFPRLLKVLMGHKDVNFRQLFRIADNLLCISVIVFSLTSTLPF